MHRKSARQAKKARTNREHMHLIGRSHSRASEKEKSSEKITIYTTQPKDRCARTRKLFNSIAFAVFHSITAAATAAPPENNEKYLKKQSFCSRTTAEAYNYCAQQLLLLNCFIFRIRDVLCNARSPVSYEFRVTRSRRARAHTYIHIPFISAVRSISNLCVLSTPLRMARNNSRIELNIQFARSTQFVDVVVVLMAQNSVSKHEL